MKTVFCVVCGSPRHVENWYYNSGLKVNRQYVCITGTRKRSKCDKIRSERNRIYVNCKVCKTELNQRDRWACSHRKKELKGICKKCFDRKFSKFGQYRRTRERDDKILCDYCGLWLEKENFYLRNNGRTVNFCKVCYGKRIKKKLIKFRQSNPVKPRPKIVSYKEARTKSRERSIREIDDRYAKSLIQAETNLKFSDIPYSLVELKRERVTLMRLLKKAKETLKNGYDSDGN